MTEPLDIPEPPQPGTRVVLINGKPTRIIWFEETAEFTEEQWAALGREFTEGRL